jgi:type IV pilus assembly protein PilW
MKIYDTYRNHSLRQSGMTIVELMVSLTIGLIILVALGQLFTTSRSAYMTEEGVARSQESGRFAMEFLTQDIRMAGFAGCSNPPSQCSLMPEPPTAPGDCGSCCNNVDPADEATTFSSEGIQGYRYVGPGTDLDDWSPALPDVFFNNGEVNAGTDVIIIQYALSTDLHLTGNMGTENGNIQVAAEISPGVPSPWFDGNTDNGEIVPDDILILSDCSNTDIFRANNVSNAGAMKTLAHSSGNVRPHISKAYNANAEILKLASRAYYVANGASGEPALWRKELGQAGAVPAAGQELVQGIEDMRFMYGVDTDIVPVTSIDNIANQYVLADNVVDLIGPGTTNWNHVVSLRLGLLIRSPANADTELDTRVYDLADGVTVDPTDDRRKRQVYRTTIQLRN